MARKNHVENPLEKKTKRPTFTENYEESLIKQLFEEKQKKLESIDISILQEQEEKT